jgi:hypothetical protein
VTYRLVVADIDGTLVTSQHEITGRVRRVVRQAQRQGVRVCLATGRTWRSGRRYFEALGADPPAILFNGGLIYDFAGDQVLFRHPMRRDQARRVIDTLDAFPDLAAHFYVGDQIYVRWRTPLVEANVRRDHIDPEAIDDFRTVVLGEPMKFRILGPPERLEMLVEAIKAADGTANHAFSERESLEVLPPGSSKGAALRRVARSLRIPLREVVAVGNESNDLTMIEAAGLGVAMGNAPEELQRAADYVAPTNDDDGLAEVMRRFVLAKTE